MADLVIPKHEAGFFSSCSVQLEKIVQHFNKNKRCAESVDRSQQFSWYKPAEASIEEYFEPVPTTIRYGRWIHYEHYYQFLNYKTLDLKSLQPFIKKFFTPSKQIRDIVTGLEQKYNIDYEKTFVVFYRGNDKVTETQLGTYDDFIRPAKEFQAAHPEWKCLVQTDETEFLERALREIPNAFCFQDEIRHIPRTAETTVDRIFKETNFQFSKNFLAITLIMAKSAHVFCGTGNCSLWIALYRGGTDRFQQFFNMKWT